eukprot:5752258-Lingulodinium_polyedra.AAC.1
MQLPGGSSARRTRLASATQWSSATQTATGRSTSPVRSSSRTCPAAGCSTAGAARPLPRASAS